MTKFLMNAIIVIVGVAPTIAVAQTIQDLGLLNPVAFEAVFPEIVFGTSGPLNFQSEIVVINPTDETALLEVEVFRSDGTSAFGLLDGSLFFHNRFTDIEENRFYKELPPHSVQRFPFSDKEIKLSAGPFVGWAKLRSNQEVSGYEEITLLHLESRKSTTADLAANSVGAVSASGRALSFKCQIYAGDPVFQNAPQIGWAISTSALAVANPGSRTLTLKFELLGKTNKLELEAHSQKTFFVWELFDFFVPKRCGEDATLQVLSETGDPFAIAFMRLDIDTDLSGNSRAFNPELRPPARLSGPGSPYFFDPVRTPITKRFDFAVPITQQVDIQDLRLVLTRFGFLIMKQGGEVLRVIKWNNQKAIKGDSKAGIVVVYGAHMPVGILFVPSRKVVTAEISGSGEVPIITDLPDKQQIKVVMGNVCHRITILLDRVKEEIVSIQVTQDPGVFCL